MSSPSGIAYCIDSTEVTKGHYGEFLETSPSASGQPAECSWNSDFVPMKPCCEVGAAPDWPYPAGEENKPVEYVNWCHATAYCKWASKRLCGRIGGGSNAFDDYKDPERSQWFNACSAGGSFAYPYGNDFVPGSCDVPDGRLVLVKEAAQCKGVGPPFDAIFDMSGNASEWEDSCKAASDGEVGCHVRGGGMNRAGSTEAEQLRCDFSEPWLDQKGSYAGLGFRCCADL